MRTPLLVLGALLAVACDEDVPGLQSCASPDAGGGCGGRDSGPHPWDVDGSPDGDGVWDAAGCPGQIPPSGESCPSYELSCSYPGERVTECACTATGWRCSDCPDLDGACAPGDSCHEEDWEHGCSCSCGDDARWSCIPDTIGSQCPGGAPDAGV
jgi:hypothetical protein